MMLVTFAIDVVPGASVDGAQTGGDVLLGLALDVERELLVELAFDAVRSHIGTSASEKGVALTLGPGRGIDASGAVMLDRQDAREIVVGLFRDVGISMPERRVDAYSWQLSGGLRQRVMIAMAIALERYIARGLLVGAVKG